jgi:hypothetical protein
MADTDAANTPPEDTSTEAANPTGYVDTGGPVDHDDSVSGGLGGTDAGSPGGMGGSRASGGTSNGNPPGGISPLQIEQETTGSPDDDEER